jgi:hypothetical protein
VEHFECLHTLSVELGLTVKAFATQCSLSGAFKIVAKRQVKKEIRLKNCNCKRLGEVQGSEVQQYAEYPNCQ